MTNSSHSTQQETSTRRRNRTIHNLNEEQLRNKRLADRKAQRAFRQRSKDCMSNLLALQEVCRQKDREIEELRSHNGRLLSHLRAICQSASAAVQLLEEENESHDVSGTASEHREAIDATCQSPRVATAAEDERRNSVVPSEAMSEVETEASPQMNTSTATGPFPVDEPSIASAPSPTALDFSVTDDALPSIPEPIANQPSAYGRSHATASNPPAAGGYDEPTPDEMHPQMSFQASTAMSSPHRPHSSRSMVSGVLPAHSMPSCPLDHILADFWKSRSLQIAQGFSVDHAVGSQTIVVTALFEHNHAAGGPPLSVMLSEVLSTFPHPQRTEKLAFFYLMYQTMRWLVSPTKQTYDLMPTWLRPTVTQITVPHPPWIDNIPWPEIRDMLIDEPEAYPFESFSENYSEYVRVNWPFESNDAVSTVDDNFVLHSIFLKHIQNLGHWTVAPEFLERYPKMAHAVKVHQDG